MYKSFAYIYDYLMDDVPYDEWVKYLIKKHEKYNITSNNILDIGCGTGELAIKLAKSNFSVTCVDISANMLSVAQNKAFEEQLTIPFFQQDMRKLNSLGQFDIITIFCDSLNYLETKEDVQETFLRVYDQLRPGGLLLFDVHSIHKINNIFINKTFGLNDEKVSYIWHCYEGEYNNSVEHELTFFLLDEKSGRYDRFDEYHKQRTFPVAEYVTMLEKAQFMVKEINADFVEKEVSKNSERIFFVAKK